MSLQLTWNHDEYFGRQITNQASLTGKGIKKGRRQKKR